MLRLSPTDHNALQTLDRDWSVGNLRGSRSGLSHSDSAEIPRRDSLRLKAPNGAASAAAPRLNRGAIAAARAPIHAQYVAKDNQSWLQ
jgi:hypothetical protein